jgi:hypothetical protein
MSSTNELLVPTATLIPSAPLNAAVVRRGVKACCYCAAAIPANEARYYVAELPPVHGMGRPVCWRHVRTEPEVCY